MITQIKIGADPEIFVKRDGKFVSGHTLIPGDKRNPYLVLGGGVQVDGVALEFNIIPVTTATAFVNVINDVLGQLRDMVPEEYEFVFEPTALFDQDYFDSLPAFPKLLGCEPDYDAYSGMMNSKPCTDKPMRTGAGHIHIGWTEGVNPLSKDHFLSCMEVVRALDETLYPAALDWDADETRRELYGKKGSFRPKHYGVEYRPLSNAWLRSEETMRRVFDITMDVSYQTLMKKELKVA